MRTLIFSAVLGSMFGFFATTHAHQPLPQTEIARTFGELPRSGNLSDILSCAGANEVFWTFASLFSSCVNRRNLWTIKSLRREFGHADPQPSTRFREHEKNMRIAGELGFLVDRALA